MAPEGWSGVQLSQLLEKVIDYRGKAPPKSEAGVRLLTARNVRMGHVSLDHAEYIDENQYVSWMNRGLPRTGDIMFTTEAPLGNVAMFPEAGTFALGQRIVTLRPKSSVSSGFLFQYLLSDVGQSKVQEKASGSTALGIKSRELVKIGVSLPPLPEQQKIAEVLGVWDRAIATTTALLANARAQKRALMQTLLTGHRRFPSFEAEPWHEVRLGDVTEVIVSNIDKKSAESERPVRLCNYTDVYKNDTIIRTMPFMEATATAGQIERFGLKVGDVIITKDSETPDDIAVPAYVAETADDLVCGYHLAIIRPGPMADGRYLKFLFELPHTKYYFGTRANGATRFGLTIDGIKDAVFQLPSPAEQHTIANVLNDAEAEISRHMKTLDRLRTEKKALMQQLLTGQRRVVV
jgi:type I restriction enzyme S subunit